MIRTKALGDLARRFEFVKLDLIAEANRESIHRARHLFGHQGDVGRGIDAAGKENSERDVGHHSLLNR